MFKKTLVAAATLATLSAGAMAAQVQVYGVMDIQPHQPSGKCRQVRNVEQHVRGFAFRLY